MKLSVIIVNYNVQHFLEQCLKSVFKSIQNIEAEVWVVDNNSVDGSVAMIKEKFPKVELVALKDNLGFSKGNNLAIKQSKGEYTLLLNPDTLVEEDTFIKVLKFMDSNPNAGGLGVKTILIKPKNHALFHYWNQPDYKTPWYKSVSLIEKNQLISKKNLLEENLNL